MADDLGFSDIGCYGSEIATPNLDSMAKSGVRFTQFYNTARCCPTRASLMTGLYSHQAGVGHMVQDRQLPGYRGDLNRQSVTIAEVLKPSGYRTMMCGKWHVTPADGRQHNWPLQRGFERYFGTIAGGGSYFQPHHLVRDNTPIEPEGKDFYYTEAISQNAVRYIREHGRKPDPFFLYVAYTSPHWPLHALEADIAKYRGRYKDGWDALRLERQRRMIQMGIVDKKWALTPRDPACPAWSEAPNKSWFERRMEVYAAQVDRMDQGIGRILASLRDTGVEDDTLVMFLADNGGCAEELAAKNANAPKSTRDGAPFRVGNDPSVMPGPDGTFQSYGKPWANASNTPFRLYKHWVHEGGISTPFIARWPRRIQKHNRLTHQVGHLIDVMATCADVGGVRYPDSYEGNRILPLEGKSLSPILEAKQRQDHEELFWEHEGNRAIRQGKWKLVSRYPDTWELYDLEADRTELNNLAGTMPGKVKELAGRYTRWAARCNVEPWEKARA